jgi:ATP phosphoribosyltransferase
VITMISIGLPKGVVKIKSLAVIAHYLRENIDSKKLRFAGKNDIYFYLLKHRDIPNMVSEGILDVGITSSEWIEEKGCSLHINRELDWCDTRVSLLSEINVPVLKKTTTIKCITEFPNLTKRFFAEYGLNNVLVEPISGSSEGLVPIIYECCVDCVETGTTLQLHNLVEEMVIYESKVVVITRNGSDPRLNNLIDELLAPLNVQCTV